MSNLNIGSYNLNTGGSTVPASLVLELEVLVIESDLTIAGMKLVNHNFGRKPFSISVCRSDGEEILPDKVQHFSDNALGVFVQKFRPLDGTWSIKLGA